MNNVYVVQRCKISTYTLVKENELSFDVEERKTPIPKVYRNAFVFFDGVDLYNDELATTSLIDAKEHALAQYDEIESIAHQHLCLYISSVKAINKE